MKKEMKIKLIFLYYETICKLSSCSSNHLPDACSRPWNRCLLH